MAPATLDTICKPVDVTSAKVDVIANVCKRSFSAYPASGVTSIFLENWKA